MSATVQPTGERMVYSVASATKPGKAYRCDLIAMGGAGQCSCTDWTIRRAPAIARKEPPGTRATLCRHLILARRHFLNDLLTAMANDTEGGL